MMAVADYFVKVAETVEMIAALSVLVGFAQMCCSHHVWAVDSAVHLVEPVELQVTQNHC